MNERTSKAEANSSRDATRSGGVGDRDRFDELGSASSIVGL